MTDFVNIFDYVSDQKIDYLNALKSLFGTNKNRSQNEYLDIINRLEPLILYDVIDALVDSKIDKQLKLNLIIYISHNYQHIVKEKMILLIPFLVSAATDTSRAVREVAITCIESVIRCSNNKDLEPLFPVLIDALKDSNKNNIAVEELASCVFVQTIDASALGVILPILQRGLRHNTYEIQRKTCVIIDNVCKLVEDPKELTDVCPIILPMVIKSANTISNPEARKVAERTLKTINSIYSENMMIKKVSTEDIKNLLQNNNIFLGSNESILVSITKNLCNTGDFREDTWLSVYARYGVEAKICLNILNLCRVSTLSKELFFEDTEDGKDLYKGEFSLAYGTLTLLKNANVHLKRNRFYGLLGPNNCGKTTLMRAISNEQIEGFPKRDELRTIFIEHEIQERQISEDEQGYPIFNIDLSGVDWIIDYCSTYAINPEREEVIKMMEQIGFGKERAADMNMPVTTYSGGWKMKMQLCAGTLLSADILMLDEPTGHLDVTNIAWLKGWLRNFVSEGGSVITTSHDSSFLNEMCSHIIDFQKRKLITFRGKLDEFVAMYPEKKGYFELKNDIIKFKFPEPGYLEGVKSMSKSILKMTGITHQYPTRIKPTIVDVALECSRISRVAVIGPNGAGKSTAIKILIGELKPSQGNIVKHPNLRIAYVAQHAFQHLEKHYTKTPTQYIMWRFAGGEDKEAVEKVDNIDEDKIEYKKYCLKNGFVAECVNKEDFKTIVEIDVILTRKENKKDKTKEYEVKWRDRSETSWVTRETLIKMGAIKLVQKFDEKEALTRGLTSKALTTGEIEKHFADFGIEPEDASHTLIRSLSGGQKVKVVLAASMWQNPHLVILDEPTNYLDRDSLGALVSAIQEFNGGVVIISHNREFCNAVCQEKWIMEGGRLRKEGESVGNGQDEIVEKKNTNDYVKDDYGNDIKVEKKVELNDKERKKEIKKLQKMINEGKKKGTLSDDEILDYELKLEQLVKLDN